MQIPLIGNQRILFGLNSGPSLVKSYRLLQISSKNNWKRDTSSPVLVHGTALFLLSKRNQESGDYCMTYELSMLLCMTWVLYSLVYPVL